jgi:hypothetical protein
MPQTLRFHLDEHVPAAIAAALRRRGIDVTTAADAGLLGATDEDHLAFAITRAAFSTRMTRTTWFSTLFTPEEPRTQELPTATSRAARSGT